jgi:hypothetical protein
MKIVLYTSITISDSSRAILYDEATELVILGHDVTVVYCGGLMNMCWKNMDKDKNVCLSCIFKQNYLDQIRVTSKVKFISLKEYLKSNNININFEYKFEYSDISDLKSILYKNVNIGLASLSSYITISRNLNPEIDDSFREYFDVLLANSAMLVDAFSWIVEDLKPDLIYAYNGRMIDSRPIWEVAVNNNIPFRVLEAQYTTTKIKKMYFNQASCFSIPELTNYISNTWNFSKLSENEKILMGSDFFIRRRNSLFSGDKIYTINQELGSLPNNFDNKKKIISIFTSSEDEFAAVGDEFEQYSLYPSQLQGIQDILNYFKEDKSIHFYIRIHPNLTDIEYSYHTLNYEFEDFENVTIIEPQSKISTYSLVDISDKVVVFGSTIGVEANFWDKPVILLAGAVYYNFGVAYLPKKPQELYNLLKLNLAPLSKKGAFMYGFIYNDSVGKDCIYIDANVTRKKINFFGKKKEFMFNNWNIFLGSKYFYYFLMLFMKVIFNIQQKLMAKTKLTIPVKEKKSNYQVLN